MTNEQSNEVETMKPGDFPMDFSITFLGALVVPRWDVMEHHPSTGQNGGNPNKYMVNTW